MPDRRKIKERGEGEGGGLQQVRQSGGAEEFVLCNDEEQNDESC